MSSVELSKQLTIKLANLVLDFVELQQDLKPVIHTFIGSKESSEVIYYKTQKSTELWVHLTEGIPKEDLGNPKAITYAVIIKNLPNQPRLIRMIVPPSSQETTQDPPIKEWPVSFEHFSPITKEGWLP